jgi:hypothetical protein
MHRPSRTAALPLPFFSMIPFKPNLLFKENNSKILFEAPFYKIVSDYFDRVFGTKIILFIP